MKAWIFSMTLLSVLCGCGANEKDQTAIAPESQEPASISDTKRFEEVRKNAMNGDYQAQRNLAYGYASSPYPGQEKNAILGCAWYKLIIKSGSEKINSTDTNNIQVYCTSLTQVEQEAAEAQSENLIKKIEK